MKKYLLITFLAIGLIGCGLAKQAGEDYKTGKETPYAQGEVTAADQSKTLANTVSGIPYVNLSTPLILLAGPYIFTWLRGRRLRKQKMEPNPNPITGKIGQAVGAESVIQHLADIAAGLFDVGHPDGLLKPGWKGALLAGFGTLVAPELAHLISGTILPALENHPPEFLAHLFNGTVLAITIGGLYSAEKWLHKVEPIAHPKTPTPAAPTA